MKSFALGLTLLGCLLLTACGSGKNAEIGSTQNHAQHKPALDVQIEINGTSVAAKVNTDLHISTAIGKARIDGEGHIHMYLDGGEKIIVKTDTYAFTDLAPGKHMLKVSLHNNDHTPYDVTKIIDFTIP